MEFDEATKLTRTASKLSIHTLLWSHQIKTYCKKLELYVFCCSQKLNNAEKDLSMHGL